MTDTVVEAVLLVYRRRGAGHLLGVLEGFVVAAACLPPLKSWRSNAAEYSLEDHRRALVLLVVQMRQQRKINSWPPQQSCQFYSLVLADLIRFLVQQGVVMFLSEVLVLGK